MANDKSKELSRSTKVSILGGASVLGGSIAKGAAKKFEASASIESLQAAQKDLDFRGDMMLAAIAQKGQKFAARQATQFSAQGVELSGSALDVILDTESSARDAQISASIEINAEKQQLAMQQAALEVQEKYALFNSILAGATKATGMLAMAEAKRQGSGSEGSEGSEDDGEYSIIDERS